MDTKAILQQCFYEIKNRNGYNPNAHNQHGYIIKKSNSRYEDLMRLKIPPLVVHGTDDSLILVDHAKKYGAMIPNSTTIILKGMGHEIPEKYTVEIIRFTFKIFEKTKTTTS